MKSKIYAFFVCIEMIKIKLVIVRKLALREEPFEYMYTNLCIPNSILIPHIHGNIPC